MTTLTKTKTCPSRYTGASSRTVYKCADYEGHLYRHTTYDGDMWWEDYAADEPTLEPALESIRARLEDDKAQFADGQYDQSIRDREYLLLLIDAL